MDLGLPGMRKSVSGKIYQRDWNSFQPLAQGNNGGDEANEGKGGDVFPEELFQGENNDNDSRTGILFEETPVC